MDHTPTSGVAAVLGVSWGTAHQAVADVGEALLIGSTKYCWRHTRKGDKCVTVIIDLTPVRGKSGLALLLDLVEMIRCVYQDIINAYRQPDHKTGKTLLTTVIDRIKTGVPKA